MSQANNNKVLMSSVSGALFGAGIAGIFMASYFFIDQMVFNNAHDYAIFYLISGAIAIFASTEIKKVNK
ncbi:hypothetical protein [Colwellia psychrerythraea]|uniref:Uncharacterized protein n=1 Tax=Colwellia psychrerythraea TaxID=28229 RepID=A0A099KH75_COLPS|nr:hypothetical protein [Colwellia psychrerythraea]KGJ88988.1 hypothetical protein GAB14E_3984 [Colwellia psychrerythraea]